MPSRATTRERGSPSAQRQPIEQPGTEVISQDYGTTLKFDVKWNLSD